MEDILLMVYQRMAAFVARLAKAMMHAFKGGMVLVGNAVFGHKLAALDGFSQCN
jgi:hypothetical protein